jgi:hypothetical protein
MRFRISLVAPVLIGALFLAAFSSAALADGSHERTQFGHDINIGPNDQVSEVTCIGCSIRIRGHVDGDATALGGSIVLEGQADVGGDTTSFGGSVRLDSGVKVGGDVTVFGGRLHRDSSAVVGGDVTSFTGGLWVLLIFGLPLIVMGGFIALIVWLVRLLMRRTVPVAA